nr:unnamed protein product [Digitaria exilis]
MATSSCPKLSRIQSAHYRTAQGGQSVTEKWSSQSCIASNQIDASRVFRYAAAAISRFRWPFQLATADTFLVSWCSHRASVADEYCCLRPVDLAACLARMASNCICSSRQSSLQKGVSPLYMKMSLSRPSGLEQSAHASSAGTPGSPIGSASKKKAHARCAAAAIYMALAAGEQRMNDLWCLGSARDSGAVVPGAPGKTPVWHGRLGWARETDSPRWLAAAASAPRTRLTRLRRDRDEDVRGGFWIRAHPPTAQNRTRNKTVASQQAKPGRCLLRFV